MKRNLVISVTLALTILGASLYFLLRDPSAGPGSRPNRSSEVARGPVSILEGSTGAIEMPTTDSKAAATAVTHAQGPGP